MTKTIKKRSRAWKIARIFLLSLFGLLLLLFLAPILFRSQIIAFAKKQLNKQLTATVDFKDVQLSLFRHFPRLDIKLVDLSIIGKDNFSGDTLLFAPSTHIVTNIKTLLRSNVKVYAIELENPDIHAKVDSTGKQNFDIAKKSSSSSTSSGGDDFTLELEKYSIHNGTLTYDDDQSKIYTEMKHFDHTGTGNFTAVKYKMDANTTADSVSFTYGTLTYLSNAVINMPLVLDIDTKTETYNFSGNNLLVNSVPLSAKGMVTAVNDSSDKVDITLKTEKAEFKNILSLIPGVYTKDINSFQTSGEAVINGKIEGLSTPSSNPNFNIRIDVTNGSVKNPGFNEALQQINVNAAIVNTGGVNDSTVITLRNGHAMVGAEPVQFALGISRPVSAMLMDLSLKGKVQLEKLQRILKMGDMDMRGLVNADLQAHGPMAAFTGQEANAIRASGYLQADNFYYKDNSTLPFNARKVNLDFTNTEGNINISDASYNKTIFSGKGSIFNFFNYIFVNAPLRAKFSASTPEINLANWTGSEGSSSTSSAAVKPFVVPADLLLDIDAQAGKLISDQIIINDLHGKVLMGNKKMLFEDISGKGFGGNINVSGSYSSEKTPLQPDIMLNYKLANLDVQQTINAIPTARSMMPIAKYLSGTLSSELTANGKLGDNFFPVLNTLNGNGNLFLLNGLLKKFAPLEALADRLGIERLRNIATKEIRNRFSFENGRVSVLPFKFTIFDNYNFEVAGQHGFDNSMDYAIKLTLPRKELGEKGNQLFASLLSQIGKTGLKLKPDEKISFFIRLTGNITQPKLDIQLDKTLSSEFDLLKDQAEEQIKGKIDSAKNALKDSLANKKNDILHGLKDKIFNKKDTVKPPVQPPPVQPAPKDSQKKKEIIKSVIDIFSHKKKDTL